MMSDELKRSEDPTTQPALPPTITMAQNLVKALVKHVGTGLTKVTTEQFKERLAVCNKCPLRLKNRCTHPACGCFLEIKAWWASEDCPDTPPRWPRLP